MAVDESPAPFTGAFSRVLVPTDGRPGIESVARVAVDVASGYDATIHALYVVDIRSEVGHWDYVVERRESEGEAAVDAVESIGDDAGLDVVKHIRYGTPHETICSYAEDHGIDLIVMGTHARSGFERFVHAGSVAERVLRAAGRPVLVVQQSDEDETERGSGGVA